MRDRIMNFEELNRATANLERIESMVGHPVDATLIDMETLSDRMLTSEEISRAATDIERVTNMRNASSTRRASSTGALNIEIILGVLYFLIGSIILLVDKIF